MTRRPLGCYLRDCIQQNWTRQSRRTLAAAMTVADVPVLTHGNVAVVIHGDDVRRYPLDHFAKTIRLRTVDVERQMADDADREAAFRMAICDVFSDPNDDDGDVSDAWAPDSIITLPPDDWQGGGS